MVAAQKLYPEALLVMPDKLAPEVEEFLSLYKDVLNTCTLKEINLAQVNRVILVDTRRPRWSDKLDALLSRPEIEIHIYDHHPPAEGDFQGTVEVFEPVGATTTILVERIKKEKILHTIQFAKRQMTWFHQSFEKQNLGDFTASNFSKKNLAELNPDSRIHWVKNRKDAEKLIREFLKD